MSSAFPERVLKQGKRPSRKTEAKEEAVFGSGTIRIIMIHIEKKISVISIFKWVSLISVLGFAGWFFGFVFAILEVKHSFTIL